MENSENTSQPKKIESKSDKDIKEIAFGIYSGTIYTSSHIKDSNMLGVVFMPLVFGALNEYDVNDVGLIYEELDKQGGRSINGHPAFMSMCVLNVEDTKKVFEKLKEIEEAIKKI